MAEASKETETVTELTKKVSDLTALVGKLTSGIETLATGQTTINESLAKFARLTPGSEGFASADSPGANSGAKDASAASALTLESLTKVLDSRDAARDAAGKKSAARQNFIASKMKDVPEVYHSLLPDTDDDGKLLAGEQTVRDRYKADLARAGHKPGDIGAAKDGGTAASAEIDTSKMSGVQMIAAGLKGDPSPR